MFSSGQFRFLRLAIRILEIFFFWWGHVPKISDRLYKDEGLSYNNSIKYFPSRQRSHLFKAGEHGFVLSRIVHSIVQHRCSLVVVVLVNSSLSFSLDMIFFLWLSIFCFILVMQL